MNGRCETDPFDQAINVCGLCFGEYCQTCLVAVKGRKHPLCKDCAIVSAGLRAGAKPVVRGSRKTAKARRTALAEAPIQTGFQYFDAAPLSATGRAAQAAANESADTDTDTDTDTGTGTGTGTKRSAESKTVAETTPAGQKRKRLPKKSQPKASKTKNTEKAANRQAKKAAKAAAKKADGGDQKTSEAAEPAVDGESNGAGSKSSAVNKLDEIREQRAASVDAPAAETASQAAAGDQHDDDGEVGGASSFRKPRPFIKPAPATEAAAPQKPSTETADSGDTDPSKAAKGLFQRSGAETKAKRPSTPKPKQSSGTGSLPKRRDTNSPKQSAPSSDQEPTLASEVVDGAPETETKSTSPAPPVAPTSKAGGLPKRRDKGEAEASTPGAGSSTLPHRRIKAEPAPKAKTKRATQDKPAAAPVPAEQTASDDAPVGTRPGKVELPRRRSSGEAETDGSTDTSKDRRRKDPADESESSPNSKIAPTLSSLSDPFEPPAWTQKPRSRHQEEASEAEHEDEHEHEDQELATAGTSKPLPKRRRQG